MGAQCKNKKQRKGEMNKEKNDAKEFALHGNFGKFHYAFVMEQCKL